MEYNPWCGISSYQSVDDYRFKGRETDVSKFLNIVCSDTMSVLYADSGIGKTSFINAGIIPRLVADKYKPLPSPILFPDDLFKQKADVEKEIVEQCKKAFHWESLLEINTNDAIQLKKLAQCEDSLWWFLHTNRIKDAQPILYFDQFEDVFSKSRKFDYPTFLTKLFKVIEELSTDIVPDKINIILNELASTGLRLKIDRSPRYKIIFSLRKEYLADFDYWTNDRYSVPMLLQNRMLLQPLTRQQAEEVITMQPLQNDPTKCICTLNQIKDDIINLIDSKGQDEVEPVILSVLCHRLFKLAQERGKVDSGLSHEELNDIDLSYIIRDFYEESIGKVIKNSRLRSFLEEKLVDDKGSRTRPDVSEFIKAGFSVDILDALKSAHVIRTEKSLNSIKEGVLTDEDSTEERIWIELIHDRVAEAVKQRKEEQAARRHNLFLYLALAVLAVSFMLLTLFNGGNSSNKNRLVSDLVQCDDYQFSTDDTLWVEKQILAKNVIVESFSIRDKSDYTIVDCPNLAQIDLRELKRDTLKLSIQQCPLLNSIILPDTLSLFDVTFYNCPSVQIHINRGLNNFRVQTFNSKLAFRVDKDVSRYEWYDKILWDIEQKRILYADLSGKIVANEPVRCRFPSKILEKSVRYDNYTFNNVSYENANEERRGGRSGQDFRYRLHPHDTIHRSEIYGTLDFVTLPDSMAYIEDRLFYNHTTLSSVSIPLTLEHIGSSAFEGCALLTQMEFPSTLRVIDGGAFKNCRGLKEIVIPENVYEIGNSAFEGCDELCKVVFKGDSIKLGARAFANCPNLVDVTWPKHYTNIFADYLSDPFLNTPAGKDVRTAEQKLKVLASSGKSLFVSPNIIVLDNQATELYIPSNARDEWRFDREPRHLTDICVPFPQPDVVVNDSRNHQHKKRFRLHMDNELKGGITLHVPYGCKKYYENLSDFDDFRQIEEMSLWETRKNYTKYLLGNVCSSLVSWSGLVYLVLLVALFYVGRLLVMGKQRNLRKNRLAKFPYLWMLLYPIFIAIMALAFYGWLRHLLGWREWIAEVCAFVISFVLITICYLREFHHIYLLPEKKTIKQELILIRKRVKNTKFNSSPVLKTIIESRSHLKKWPVMGCLAFVVVGLCIFTIHRCGYKDWSSAIQAGDYNAALRLLAEDLADKDTLTDNDVHELKKLLIKTGLAPQYTKEQPIAYNDSYLYGSNGLAAYCHDTLVIWYGGRHVKWNLNNQYGSWRFNQRIGALDLDEMHISHYNSEKDSSYIFDMTDPELFPRRALKGRVVGHHLTGPYYWMEDGDSHYLIDEKGRTVMIPPSLYTDSVIGYKKYGSTVPMSIKTSFPSLGYENFAVVTFKDKKAFGHPASYFFGCTDNGPIVSRLSDKDNYYSTLNDGRYLVLRRQVSAPDEDGHTDRAIVICDISHNHETIMEFETELVEDYCDGNFLILSDNKQIVVYKPGQNYLYSRFDGTYKKCHGNYVCYKKDNKYCVYDVLENKHHEIDIKYYSSHSELTIKGNYLVLYDNTYHLANVFALNDKLSHVCELKADKFEDNYFSDYYLKGYINNKVCYYYMNDDVQAGAELTVPTEGFKETGDFLVPTNYSEKDSFYRIIPLRDNTEDNFIDLQRVEGRASMPIITGNYILQIVSQGKGGIIYPMKYEGVKELLQRSSLSDKLKQNLILKLETMDIH